jgi:hypothetical protein
VLPSPKLGRLPGAQAAELLGLSPAGLSVVERKGRPLKATSTDSRSSRVAKNQRLFRAVNEQIARLLVEETHLVRFLCECRGADCQERLSLTCEELLALRRVPTRFAVCPGHVDRETERVVGRSDAYVIVEALGETAAVALVPDQHANGSAR